MTLLRQWRITILTLKCYIHEIAFGDFVNTSRCVSESAEYPREGKNIFTPIAKGIE